jgi:hypothetical protein
MNPKPGVLVIQKGLVGRSCTQKIEKLPRGAATDAAVRARAAEFKKAGYKPMPDRRLKTVAVQIQLKAWGSEKDLDRRNDLMELLDEHLGDTANGHVDGGDMGSGTANIWCMVVNPDVAAKTIIALLKRKRQLKDIVVAIDRGKKFDVTYPRDFKGQFSF